MALLETPSGHPCDANLALPSIEEDSLKNIRSKTTQIFVDKKEWGRSNQGRSEPTLSNIDRRRVDAVL